MYSILFLLSIKESHYLTSEIIQQGLSNYCLIIYLKWLHNNNPYKMRMLIICPLVRLMASIHKC